MFSFLKINTGYILNVFDSYRALTCREKKKTKLTITFFPIIYFFRYVANVFYFFPPNEIA